MTVNASPRRKATAAGAGGTVALVVVWLLGHFGVQVSAEAGVVIGSGALATARYLGKHGIAGAARQLWRGAS